MQAEEGGYVPGWSGFAVTCAGVFVLWGFGLSMNLFILFPSADVGEPDEERGGDEAGEQGEHLVGSHVTPPAST